MNRERSLVFETSRSGRVGYRLPPLDVPAGGATSLSRDPLTRKAPLWLPELSEVDVVRHYTGLARDTYCVDLGFYPLGSCTMKYSPKINDELAHLDGFESLHPLQPDEDAQGTLALMHDLLVRLCEVTGMQWGSLQPFAGAHGEFTGMKLFRAYFAKRGETQRTRILVPDSAHGTNPASAHIAGFEVQEIKSDYRGMVSRESIREYLDDRLAGIMLTNPNTLGLFERDIVEIAHAVHDVGGLLYYDGANLNAIMGKVRPGDMGFDVVHLNLHKTFSTPHGGGGPGAGPVLVNDRLRPFLPSPDIEEREGCFRLTTDRPDSIGRVAGFYGNVGVLIRAYAYLLTMGGDGLTAASERAVLNANYLRERLRTYFQLPYDALCKHEFVLSASRQKERSGVGALDIAKRLLDYRIHPPTVYFPLIVAEAMMIEPTETESKEVLDDFVSVMAAIAEEADSFPQRLHDAPVETPVRRVDEVLAAKHPIVAWRKQ
jgi:glycine dehydrogenase subunit 2